MAAALLLFNLHFLTIEVFDFDFDVVLATSLIFDLIFVVEMDQV